MMSSKSVSVGECYILIQCVRNVYVPASGIPAQPVDNVFRGSLGANR